MDERGKKTYYRLKYFCIIGTILSGTCTTILAKYLDDTSFSYELFQTLFMFIGESLCVVLVVYSRVLNAKTPSAGQQNNYLHSWFISKFGKKVYAISGFCDFFGSYLQGISYNLLSNPVLMSFKMILIFNMFLYRVLIIRRKVFRHQVLGLLLLSIGMMLVVLMSLVSPNNHQSFDRNGVIGIILMLFAQIFNMFDFISMEYFMWNLKTEAAEVITIKGISGILMITICYVPLQFIYTQDSKQNSLGDPFNYLNAHAELIPFLILFMLGTCIFNFFLAKTIQVTDSLSVCTLDSGRTITYWAISFAFVSTRPDPLEIAGAFLLALGLCIYNEILIIPCWGLEKSAQRNLKENQVYKEIRQKSRVWQTRLDSLMLE